jgi:hypothetical protein
MKKALFLVAIGLLSAVAAADGATKVFLLGGQSNMAGVGNYPGGTISGITYPPDLLPSSSPYYPEQTNVKYWNNGWTNLRIGFGYDTSKNEFGPEVSFGYTLKRLFPQDDIYLVKWGVSGSNLAVDWNPDVAGGKYCYTNFKSRVNAALSNLRNAQLSPVVAGMIWMQGESDTSNADYAAAYKSNLINFIDQVRTDFGTSETPFVLGRILTVFGTPENNDVVRSAQMTVSDSVSHVSWFSTDNLQLVYPGHYGSQGQGDLGVLFANKFAVPEPSMSAIFVVGLFGFAVAALSVRVRRNAKNRH